MKNVLLPPREDGVFSSTSEVQTSLSGSLVTLWEDHVKEDLLLSHSLLWDWRFGEWSIKWAELCLWVRLLVPQIRLMDFPPGAKRGQNPGVRGLAINMPCYCWTKHRDPHKLLWICSHGDKAEQTGRPTTPPDRPDSRTSSSRLSSPSKQDWTTDSDPVMIRFNTASITMNCEQNNEWMNNDLILNYI